MNLMANVANVENRCSAQWQARDSVTGGNVSGSVEKLPPRQIFPAAAPRSGSTNCYVTSVRAGWLTSTSAVRADSGDWSPSSVLKDQLASHQQYIDMFVREGKLSVQLKPHPVIVKTYEIGRVRGTYFICMEYISGIDLSLLLRRCRGGRSRRMPIPHAVYVVSRVCEGLHYAHELSDNDGRSLNLVNRDVSPSNVRISFDGKVKVLDFGIAKAASTLSSEIGVLKGKISYMSPEQVRGLPLDRRSDVFSTAILLHEMLNGREAISRRQRVPADGHGKTSQRQATIRSKPPSAQRTRCDRPQGTL